MTAFELCSKYKDERFRLKGGYVVWESISYLGDIDKCYISRLIYPHEKIKGKPWFMGVRQMNRYISPDTIVIVIP